MAPKIEKLPHGVCRITLDNEKSLNAVTHETVKHMRDLLLPHVAGDAAARAAVSKAFVIRGAGAKAFCAGGDVVSIAKQEPAGVRERFFYTEYQVNYAIGELSVPYIALWNGIVMGGGFGVSVHGSHRVCSPQTLFAMPETAIGLFPDVGGSWVLPRLPIDGLGLYLALSGARLKGADVVHAGLGTHYVTTPERLDLLEQRLVSPDGPSPRAAIAEHCESRNLLPAFSLAPHIDKIAKYFGKQHATLASVVGGLKASTDPWAADIYKKLVAMSPTSVAVSFEAQRRGAKCATRAEMFAMEFCLSQSMANHHDFYEGVDALLLSKHKNPKWAPATLDEVDQAQVARMFDKFKPSQPTWDPTTPEAVAFADAAGAKK